MQVPEAVDPELQTLYAIMLGWPVNRASFSIRSLSGETFAVEKLAGVSLLGTKIIHLYSYYGRCWKDTRVEKNY